GPVLRHIAGLTVHLHGALALIFERRDQIVFLIAPQHARIPGPVEQDRLQVLCAGCRSILRAATTAAAATSATATALRASTALTAPTTPPAAALCAASAISRCARSGTAAALTTALCVDSWECNNRQNDEDQHTCQYELSSKGHDGLPLNS